MSPEQFKAWRAHMRYTQTQAAEALDLSPETIGYYDLGRRRDGREVTIPKTVELACAALALGMTSYGGPSPSKAHAGHFFADDMLELAEVLEKSTATGGKLAELERMEKKKRGA